MLGSHLRSVLANHGMGPGGHLQGPSGARQRRSREAVVVGLLLVAASASFLTWNEERAAVTERTLAEGRSLVTEVEVDRVDPSRDGDLIHISGPLAVAADLADDELGLTARGVRLERKVEMYAWEKDTTRDADGVESIHWSRRWTENPQPGEGTKHRNPRPAFSSRVSSVPEARVGDFVLTPGVLSRLDDTEPFALDERQHRRLQRVVGTPLVGHDEWLFTGDPAHPEVGDLRFTFSIVPVGDITVVGQQSGDSVRPYLTTTGRSLLLTEPGTKTAAEMFDRSKQESDTVTRVLRGAGLLAMLGGFFGVFAPLARLFNSIPVIGAITTLWAGVGALALTAVFGPLVIVTGFLRGVLEPLFDKLGL